MKSLKYNHILVLPALFSSGFCNAAPGGGPPPPPVGSPPGPPGFPIDGGILLLLMVAIFYGIFIVNQYKNKKGCSN
jgi:hypothetical protein